jgi:hypothetical protein
VEAADVEDLAKKTQNPVSDLAWLPFDYNIEFGTGTRSKDRHILNIQPVVPVALNTEWNLISRLIVPIESFPEFAPLSGRQSGLGDLSYSAFLSPNSTGSILWGFGPVVIVPMVTDPPLGTGKWSIGPSAVVLGLKGRWIAGALISNVWSFAGDESRADVNLMTLQPFLNYNMRNGWFITSMPIMTFNWEAPSGEESTIPLGGGFGRVFRVGNRPMRFQIQGFGYAEKPSGGPDWALNFQLSLLFPK